MQSAALQGTGHDWVRGVLERALDDAILEAAGAVGRMGRRAGNPKTLNVGRTIQPSGTGMVCVLAAASKLSATMTSVGRMKENSTGARLGQGPLRNAVMRAAGSVGKTSRCAETLKP